MNNNNLNNNILFGKILSSIQSGSAATLETSCKLNQWINTNCIVGKHSKNDAIDACIYGCNAIKLLKGRENNMIKAYHICYHTDEDGRAAAAIIYEYLKRINKPDSNKVKYFFYKIDYTMDLRTILPANIPAGDEIYFVDYSFSNKDNLDYVIELSNNDIKITWIDHHKTSLDVVYENNLSGKSNLRCFIDTRYCGAYLAYVYAWLNLNYTIEEFENFDKHIDYIPLYIKYVDSWDTWKHNMPNTTEFNLGMNLEKQTPKGIISSMFKFNSIMVNKLFSCKKEDVYDIERYMKEYIDDVISKGKIIKQYQDIENKNLCDKYGFEFTIIDHTAPYRLSNNNDTGNGAVYKCFALNKRGSSTMFGDRYSKYDIVATFAFDGSKYIYSFYSNWPGTVDCADLAKKIAGGGGHVGAAGFTTQCKLLEADCEISISKKLFSKDKYNIYVH